MSNATISIRKHLEFVTYIASKLFRFVPDFLFDFLAIFFLFATRRLKNTPLGWDCSSSSFFLFFLLFFCLNRAASLLDGWSVELLFKLHTFTYKINIHQSSEAAVHLFLSLAHLSSLFVTAVTPLRKPTNGSETHQKRKSRRKKVETEENPQSQRQIILSLFQYSS